MELTQKRNKKIIMAVLYTVITLAVIAGVILAIGFGFGLFTVIRKILQPEILVGYSSLMAVLLFVSGMIMLLLGMIGEYLGRIYISINNSPQYVIRQTVNMDEESHGGHNEKA